MHKEFPGSLGHKFALIKSSPPPDIPDSVISLQVELLASTPYAPTLLALPRPEGRAQRFSKLCPHIRTPLGLGFFCRFARGRWPQGGDSDNKEIWSKKIKSKLLKNESNHLILWLKTLQSLFISLRVKTKIFTMIYKVLKDLSPPHTATPYPALSLLWFLASSRSFSAT